MEIPKGWKGEIYSRSGLASKGIFVGNSPGKIDSDYRGEIKVIIHNTRREIVGIHAGDRIAQFEINPVHDIEWEEGELDETDRGEGGFGSTGS
jgi:dUTP pyrophosphatase